MRQKIVDALCSIGIVLGIGIVSIGVNAVWFRSTEGLALAIASGLGGGLIAAVMRIRELKRQRRSEDVEESI